jgi:hypothetical protein
MKAKVRGVCAFDLDDTLTCGDAAGAIARCEQAGYGIAVNTARPSAWLEERLQGIGLPPLDSPAFAFNPRSYSQSPSERANCKGAAMHRLAQHFKTRNVILFDDLPENVEAAIREGYRGKVVSQPGQPCGISADIIDQVLEDSGVSCDAPKSQRPLRTQIKSTPY